MNTIKYKNKKYKTEMIWRESKKDLKKDADNKLFKFPKEGKIWSDKEQFNNKLKKVNKYLQENNKFTTIKNKDCLLCDKKNITNKIYYLNGIIWEDGIEHYISVHNIKPSYLFMDIIYNFNFPKKYNTNILHSSQNIVMIHNIKYIKFERNQILILDALLRHGGGVKKKYHGEFMYRYSEHAGIIDIKAGKIDKIIISAQTNIVNKNDEEIYLPSDIKGLYKYDYIWHNHPMEAKPGGRAKYGIIYEMPSISDIFHFIDHFNDGAMIGSIVLTAEGLYLIRKLTDDIYRININDNELFRNLRKTYDKINIQSSEIYGSEFSNYYFYSVIAQDKTYIDMVNIILSQFQLRIDYYPRIKSNNQWIVDTLYLPIYI
jgi:hypothetical protein